MEWVEIGDEGGEEVRLVGERNAGSEVQFTIQKRMEIGYLYIKMLRSFRQRTNNEDATSFS